MYVCTCSPHTTHTTHTHTHAQHTYTHRERERERERGEQYAERSTTHGSYATVSHYLSSLPPPPSPLPRLPMNMLDKWREALIKAPLPRQPVSHYPHPSHLFAADSAHMHPLPAHIYCLCESLDQTCVLPLAVSQCVFQSPCPMLMFRSIVTQ